MNTVMTLQVRELKTGWNPLTIGRVERIKNTLYLKDTSGRLICKSANIETVAAAGRRYAKEQGFFDAAYA